MCISHHQKTAVSFCWYLRAMQHARLHVLVASYVICRQRGAVRPCLVVVPKSTLLDWEREFATWAPQWNVVTLHGNHKARRAILKWELTCLLRQRRLATWIIWTAGERCR